MILGVKEQIVLPRARAPLLCPSYVAPVLAAVRAPGGRRLHGERGRAHKLLLIGTALPGTAFDALIETLGLRDAVVTVPHAPHAEIALASTGGGAAVVNDDYLESTLRAALAGERL